MKRRGMRVKGEGISVKGEGVNIQSKDEQSKPTDTHYYSIQRTVRTTVSLVM